MLFADDTNIFAEDSNPAELFGKVNRGLGELSRWFRCNRLTLNLKKTEYVYFSGPGGVSFHRGDKDRGRSDKEGGWCPLLGCLCR